MSVEFKSLIELGEEASQNIVDFALNKALKFNTNASITLRNAVILLIFLLVVMFVLCMLIASALSKAISRPINEIADIAGKFTSGTLNIKLNINQRMN